MRTGKTLCLLAKTRVRELDPIEPTAAHHQLRLGRPVSTVDGFTCAYVYLYDGFCLVLLDCIRPTFLLLCGDF